MLPHGDAGAASVQFYPHANQIMAHLMRLLNVGVHVVASVKPGAREGQGRPKKEQKDIDIHSIDRTLFTRMLVLPYSVAHIFFLGRA